MRETCTGWQQHFKAHKLKIEKNLSLSTNTCHSDSTYCTKGQLSLNCNSFTHTQHTQRWVGDQQCLSRLSKHMTRFNPDINKNTTAHLRLENNHIVSCSYSIEWSKLNQISLKQKFPKFLILTIYWIFEHWSGMKFKLWLKILTEGQKTSPNIDSTVNKMQNIKFEINTAKIDLVQKKS